MGTFKIGRDLGVFASDAILNDMTLLGVGTVGGSTGGGNTSLGRIGVGYLYADWKAQIQRKSPKYKFFGGTVSYTLTAVDPWAVSVAPEIMIPMEINVLVQEKYEFGAEGKVNYVGEWEDFKLSFWVGYIYQPIRAANPEARNFVVDFISRTVHGGELGGKVESGPFSLVGYTYTGSGIGTTGFLQNGFGLSFDGTSLTLAKRHSDGFYVQGTVVVPDTGTKLGLSYGQSNLDLTGGEEDIRNNPGVLAPVMGADISRALAETLGNVVKKNSSWIAGVYHPLSEALNLVAEYTNTEAQAQAGHKAKENVFALGAIMFF